MLNTNRKNGMENQLERFFKNSIKKNRNNSMKAYDQKLLL